MLSLVIGFFSGVIFAICGVIYLFYVLNKGLFEFADSKQSIILQEETKSEEKKKDISIIDLKTTLYITMEFQKKRFSIKSLIKDKVEVKTASLKNNTIFFYKQNSTDCESAIVVDGCEVTTYPEDLLPSEIWQPKYPLKITHKSKKLYNSSDTFFLLFQRGVDKEEWFRGLRKASKISDKKYMEVEYKMAELQKKYMTLLLDRISSPQIDPGIKWLNAFLGRIFWDLNSENDVAHSVKAKINRKIDREISLYGKPSFLESLAVKDVSMGQKLPIVKSARFMSLSEDGSLTFDVDLSYEGGFKLIFELIAVYVLPFKKTLRVPIAVEAQALSFSGRMQVKAKAPPANCMWIAFTEKPKIELSILPVRSQKFFKLNMIGKLIHRIIGDVIEHNLVLPNMEDVSLPGPQVVSSVDHGAAHEIEKLQRRIDILNGTYKPPESIDEEKLDEALSEWSEADFDEAQLLGEDH